MKLAELDNKTLFELTLACATEMNSRLLLAKQEIETVKTAIEFCQYNCMVGDICADEIIANLNEQRLEMEKEAQ